ncbi:MAG: glycosyltransferase [Candidatus Omnitrophica bacterium]|nr:glycosyltransferase [Candidatus Omnitrophota bacterium]
MRQDLAQVPAVQGKGRKQGTGCVGEQENTRFPSPVTRYSFPVTPIRLLYVIDKLTRAGSQKHLLQLVRSLPRQKFDIQIIALECGGPLEEELRSLNVPYRIIGISNWNSLGGIGGFAKLLNEMNRFKPDIVHSYLFTANFFSPIAARLLKIPAVIASRRDLGDWMSARQIGMCRFASRFVDLVLANSNAVRDEAIKREALNPQRLRIVHNGIRPDEFLSAEPKGVLRKRLNFPENAMIVGTLGNIRTEKDPMTFLRAFEVIALRHPDALLVYGGRVKDEKLKADMDGWIHEHGLKDQVRFTGEVERTEDFLGAMDIFVFTSKTEGLSNAILEAMAASLPIVAARVGGNVEQILDGISGYLFPSGDFCACAELIEKLMASTERRREMGSQGRARLAEIFNEERMAENTAGIYKELLQTKRVRV